MNRLKSVVAVVLLSLSVACAQHAQPSLPSSTGSTIGAVTSLSPSDADVQSARRDAIAIADEVTKVTSIVRDVRNAAQALNKSKAITNKRMDQIDDACLAYVKMARIALTGAQRALSRPSLINTAEMVAATVSDLTKELTGSGVPGLSDFASRIRALMPTTFQVAGGK